MQSLVHLRISALASRRAFRNFAYVCPRFWDRLTSLVYPHPVLELPFETNFCTGFSCQGKVFNLSSMQLQPYYLASGAVPSTDCCSLNLPGSSLYKLFKLSLHKDSDHLPSMTLIKIKAIANPPVDLCIWMKHEDSEKLTVLEQKDCVDENTWDLLCDRYILNWIGVSTHAAAVLESFSVSLNKNSLLQNDPAMLPD
ncbi:hypothetical protein AB6A40_008255 [Gnathostoma spinigerum]|uniref:Uncharacterized protein n=1 Tax=Gnathostoma spinigerum TaxID=75299 RepID=A0ABD6EP01_9BILA